MYQSSVRSATAGTTKTFLALVAILSLLLSMFAVSATPAAADHDPADGPAVSPTLVQASDEFPGGNVPCPEGTTELRFDPAPDGTYSLSTQLTDGSTATVTVTVSGNTLETFVIEGALAQQVHLKATDASNIYDYSGLAGGGIAHDDGLVSPATDSISHISFCLIPLITGDLVIHKTDGTGALEGVTFTLTGENLDAPLTDVTDAEGLAEFLDLLPGTYTLTETTPDGYTPMGPWTVTVAADGSVSVAGLTANGDGSFTIINTLIVGSITVNKEIACEECETRTPGYWFNTAGSHDEETDALLAELAAMDGGSDDSVVEVDIDGTVYEFGTAADVRAFVDADRSGDWDGEAGLSHDGNLLRHYLSTWLNVLLNGEDCDLLERMLGDQTVGEILDEAAAALAADDADAEVAALEKLTTINESDDAEENPLTCGEAGNTAADGFTFDLYAKADYPDGDPLDSGTTGDAGTTGELVFEDLVPGTYVLVETDNEAGEDCSIVSVSLGGTLNEDGSITVTITEESRDVVLTVVNECEGGNGGEESGHITVIKETDEAEPAESFAFSASWDETGFTLMHGEWEPSGDLAVGDYTVTETLTADQIEAGWSLADIDCGDADVDVALETSTVTIHLADGDDVTCTFSNEQEEQGGGTGGLEIDKFNCIGEADHTLFFVFGPFSRQAEPDTESCTVGAGVTFSVYTDAGEGVPGVFVLSDTTDENGIIEVDLDPDDYVLVEGAEGEDGPSQPFTVEEGSTTAIVVLNVTAEEEQTGEVKILKFACPAEEDAVVFYEEGDETIPNLTECEVADATFTIDDGEEFTTENGGTVQTVTADVEHTLTEVDPLSGSTTFSVGADDLLTIIVINYQGEQQEQTGSITVNKEIECDMCETRTPGYYFNQGENNAGTAFAEESLSSEPITVGGFTFASVQDVQDNAAPGSLLRHYLALVLNVRMAEGSECDLWTAVYSGSVEALQGLTVGEILDEAKAVLNGGDSSYSEEQLHDAIDEINNASETDNGALSCETTTGTAGFEFTLTDEADMTWTGTTGDDGSYTFEDLPLGVYTLEETGGPEGSDCTIVSATGTGVEFDAETGIVTITLTEENADVSVTVVNACGGESGEQFGSITIIKNAVPDAAQDFAFTTTGTGLSGFSLDDDADGTLSNQRTFSGLAAGSYSVTEAATTGWTLTSITCSTGGTADLAGRTANITLAAGANVTCTFVNTQQGGGTLPGNPVQGGGGVAPTRGGTLGGTLPNTALNAEDGVSIPAALLALLLLGGLAGAGHLAAAEARRRR